MIHAAKEFWKADRHKTFGKVGELGKFSSPAQKICMQVYMEMYPDLPDEANFWWGTMDFSQCLAKWCEIVGFPKLNPTELRKFYTTETADDEEGAKAEKFNRSVAAAQGHAGPTGQRSYNMRKAKKTAIFSKAATEAILGQMIQMPEIPSADRLVERAGELAAEFKIRRRKRAQIDADEADAHGSKKAATRIVVFLQGHGNNHSPNNILLNSVWVQS